MNMRCSSSANQKDAASGRIDIGLEQSPEVQSTPLSPKERIGSTRSQKRVSRCGVMQWGVLLILCFLCSLGAGIVCSQVTNINGTPVEPHTNACQLQVWGAEPAIATKPWEPANTQWLLGVILAIVFILRKYVLPAITRELYGSLPMQKQIKISNYMLELLGTTCALAVSVATGLWELLFTASAYKPHPNPQQAYDLALGMQLSFACFVPMYIMELAFDESMRVGLMLHHWLSILLALWGVVMIYEIDNDTSAIRMFFALSLYMSTEQNVFIEMLAYHRKIYWPILYTASAWFYLVTRLCIMVLSLWSWVECYNVVFLDGVHNNIIVYGLWFFVPPANAILNATQWTTVTSLFGIAGAVRRKSRERKQQEVAIMKVNSLKGGNGMPSEADPNRMPSKAETELECVLVNSGLFDIFTQIDMDDSGCISLSEWKQYVRGRDLNLALPTVAIVQLFHHIDIDGCDQVDLDTFQLYFSELAMPSVSFDLVLTGALLKTMLEADPDDNYYAALASRYAVVLDDLRRANGGRLDNAWALLPRSCESAVCKSLTEPPGRVCRVSVNADPRAAFADAKVPEVVIDV